MNYVNQNGRLVKDTDAYFPVTNWSLRFGYGLFETMLVQDGRIRLAQYHWNRLAESIVALGWQFPPHFSIGNMEAEVLRTVARNNAQKMCRVRLQVYPNRTGVFDTENNTVEYLIECMEVQTAAIQWNENGLLVGLAETVRKSPDAVSHLKTCNTLLYTLAADEARRMKWNDALIRNPHDRIVESTIANLFVVKNNRLITPPLSEGCIAGTMRRFLLAKIPGVIESPVRVDDLAGASEVFLANAVRGVKWVGEIAGTKYQCRVTKEIHQSLFHNPL